MSRANELERIHFSSPDVFVIPAHVSQHSITQLLSNLSEQGDAVGLYNLFEETHFPVRYLRMNPLRGTYHILRSVSHAKTESLSKNALIDQSVFCGSDLVELDRAANLSPRIFNSLRMSTRRGILHRGSIELCSLQIPESLRGNAVQLIYRLLDLFDPTRSDEVDFRYISSGLALLCGISRDKQVHAAFDCFDVDGDGLLNFDDLCELLVAYFRYLNAPTHNGNTRMCTRKSSAFRQGSSLPQFHAHKTFCAHKILC